MSRLLRILLLFVLLGYVADTIPVCAQSACSWEQFLGEYAQYVTQSEDESETLVERYDWLDELEELHQHPMNINTASRQDLQQLHFLNDEQIDSLLARRDRYHGFRSLGELMTVRQLSYRDRAWLSQFLTFQPLPFQTGQKSSPVNAATPYRACEDRNPWTGGTHEVMATADVPLYRRAGFSSYSDEDAPRKAFLGALFAHTLRYRYQYEQRVRYGVTLQQDVGEQWAAGGARPWDASFFYLNLREKAYELCLGDFQISLGQGLLASSSTWHQFSDYLSGLNFSSVSLRPHTGTEENRFLRGAAGTYRFGAGQRCSVTAFASYRQKDGTLKDVGNEEDAETADTLTAWKVDGLHRTQQEVEKRRVCGQYVFGGRVGYADGRWSLGFNATYAYYNKVYFPTSRSYNQYVMRGQEAAAVSLDYAWQRKHFGLQGELAVDPLRDNVQPQQAAIREGYRKQQPYASTIAAYWSPRRTLSFVLQERSFGRDFVTPLGRTQQAGSQLQNEHGALLGMNFQGIRHLVISGYVDVAYHPDPVYRADTASKRVQALLHLTYSGDRRWQHSLSYRVKSVQTNVNEYEGILLEWCTTQHLRWQSVWSNSRWTAAFGADGAFYNSQVITLDQEGKQQGGLQKGALLYARTSGSITPRLQCSAFLGLFHTEDYATRCYAYLPQLRGAAMIPNFYGRGGSAVLMAEARVWKRCYVAARFSSVKYFDRDEISSGINLISSSWKNDLSVQMRWKI